jgi:UDP-N-acetyl-D-glucosamine dehydrogenase
MPRFVAGGLVRILHRQGGDVRGRVLVLGVSFEKDVADVRNSPALDLVGLLEARGVELSHHDPFVPRLPLGGRERASVALSPGVIAGADCVVIHIGHTMLDYEWVVAYARLVRATRNVTRDVKQSRTKVVRL